MTEFCMLLGKNPILRFFCIVSSNFFFQSVERDVPLTRQHHGMSYVHNNKQSLLMAFS